MSLRRVLLVAAAALALLLLGFVVDRLGRGGRALRVVVEEGARPRGALDRPLRLLAYNIAHGRGPDEDTSNITPQDEKRRRVSAIAGGCASATPS